MAKLWIEINSDNRVIFSATSETGGLIEVDRPASFIPENQMDWKYQNNTIVYDPDSVPSPEPDSNPLPIETLRADVDYILMLIGEE